VIPVGAEAFSDAVPPRVRPLPLPEPRATWAYGGSTGAGQRVAVIDSGVETDHPLIGRLAGAVVVTQAGNDPNDYRVEPDSAGDLVGHGTACAGIIRRLAPDVELHSVRVLGANLKGRAGMFAAGLRWAVDEGMDIVNLSLSTANRDWLGRLHELADLAFFRGTLLVCAVNNVPTESFPSQYAAVVSVAARESDDPFGLVYNAAPPVEFGARGVNVDVAWRGGGTATVTGNSFAAPHVAGLAALVRAKHPGLTPFQVKSVLHALAENAQDLESSDTNT
jgi:subtilisin